MRCVQSCGERKPCFIRTGSQATYSVRSRTSGNPMPLICGSPLSRRRTKQLTMHPNDNLANMSHSHHFSPPPHLGYTGSLLERAADRRADPAALAAPATSYMHAARTASWGPAGASAGPPGRRANLEIRGRVRVAMRPGWPVVPLVAQSNGLTSFAHTPRRAGERVTAVASVAAVTASRVGADGFLLPCRA